MRHLLNKHPAAGANEVIFLVGFTEPTKFANIIGAYYYQQRERRSSPRPLFIPLDRCQLA
jgi:hypothetical protein